MVILQGLLQYKFYAPDGLLATQKTFSKFWWQNFGPVNSAKKLFAKVEFRKP